MEIFLKNFFRNLKINQYYIRILAFIYLRIKNYSYRKESEKRKEYSIFDYLELSKEMKLYPNELHFGNSLYGIEKTLKEFTNYNKMINSCIEHGIYFGDYYSPYEVNSGLKNIITFSENRREKLKKQTQQDIFPIGPYIYYAKNLYSDEVINKYKNKLGKTLLFFPCHSIKEVDVNYNVDEIIKQLKTLKKNNNYKTILICLYYNDILQNKYKKYEEAGFVIITAGHKYDQYFLRRLRTIFEISDEVASNDIGTHTAYSFVMQKKYIILENKEKIDYKPLVLEQEHVFEEKYERSRKYEKDRLCTYLKKNDSEKIKYYFGMDNIKTKKELLNILLK